MEWYLIWKAMSRARCIRDMSSLLVLPWRSYACVVDHGWTRVPVRGLVDAEGVLHDRL